MSTYMLVARNKKDNTFKIIGIKESWYKSGGDDENVCYKNSLPSIDLVTSRFLSREDMQKRLIEKGYIAEGEYDFFVASKTKSGSSNPVKFQEVIYRPEQNERMAEFRTVASASHAGRMKEVNDKVLRIFNKLLTKSFHRPDFHHMIQNGYTGLPKKLVDALAGVRECKDVPYSLKYKERWAVESYPVIRNIIEALNRYDLLVSKDNNIINANVGYFNENVRGRRSLMNELNIILDKDFTPGQLNLLGDNTDDVWAVSGGVIKEEVVTPIVEVKKPKYKIPEFSDDGKVDIDNIMRFLLKLPYEVFIYDENKQLTFNFDVFDYELDDDTKKKLNSLLTSYLRSHVHMYLFHKMKYDELNGVSYGHSQFILMDDMADDKKDIRKNLEKRTPAGLSRVNEWCKLCSACGQMNEMMNQDSEQLGDGAISRKR